MRSAHKELRARPRDRASVEAGCRQAHLLTVGEDAIEGGATETAAPGEQLAVALPGQERLRERRLVPLQGEPLE